MIAYYCDRCGKAIVDGTIYRVAITAECISILGTAEKSFLYNGEEEQPEEQPEGWKARMLEKFQKRV